MSILNKKTKNNNIKTNASMLKSRIKDMCRIDHVLKNIEGVNTCERFR